ncbi:glycosyltransferase [Planococcus rifietoensis]|uniref:glycosyltransferase n=1 Tax=Planococcus rifietoensis TaxID=200991 RepID=UPI00384FE05C
MKIVHLALMHSDKDSRIFRKECLSLEKNGHTVTYITSNNKEVLEINEESNITVIKMPLLGKSKAAKRINYYKSIHKLALELDADIYHIHEPDLLVVGDRLSSANRIVVFDAHEDYQGYKYGANSKSSITKKVKMKLISIAYWNLIKYSSLKINNVITAGENIANYYRGKELNVEVLNNYPILNNDYDSIPKEEYLKRQNLVCYVGGVNNQRRIENLLGIFKNQIDSKFVYAGPIHPSLKYVVENDSTSVYKGILDAKEMQNLYRSSKVGVILLTPEKNHYDIQSNKLFEYMENSLPVICSNFPRWKEFVEKNKCGIAVDPMDDLAIKRAIDFLIENPEKAYEMGRNGREAVVNEYNWKKEEEKLIKYYNKIT